MSPVVRQAPKPTAIALLHPGKATVDREMAPQAPRCIVTETVTPMHVAPNIVTETVVHHGVMTRAVVVKAPLPLRPVVANVGKSTPKDRCIPGARRILIVDTNISATPEALSLSTARRGIPSALKVIVRKCGVRSEAPGMTLPIAALAGSTKALRA